jgi:hypothetical protein
LELAGNGTTTSGGDFTVASGAVLDLTGGHNHFYTGSYTGVGAGTVRLNSDVLLIGAEGATFDFSGDLFQWTGGRLQGPGVLTNTGTLNISGSNTKLLNGITLANAGTVVWSVTGAVSSFSGSVFNNLESGVFEIQNNGAFGGPANTFNNAGIVTKSVDAGTMTLGGLFVQTSTGVLNLKIGGISDGQYDRLNVNSAMLDGTLNINLINGFTPTSGDSFQVMTYGSHTGTFATINGNGQTYIPNYNASNLTLVAQ